MYRPNDRYTTYEKVTTELQVTSKFLKVVCTADCCTWCKHARYICR